MHGQYVLPSVDSGSVLVSFLKVSVTQLRNTAWLSSFSCVTSDLIIYRLHHTAFHSF